MRIALVNNFFLPRTSGSAYQTAQLAETMADRGHEVLVVTAAQGAKPGEFRVGGYRVARLSCVTLPPLSTMRYDVNFALSPRNIRTASMPCSMTSRPTFSTSTVNSSTSRG